MLLSLVTVMEDILSLYKDETFLVFQVTCAVIMFGCHHPFAMAVRNIHSVPVGDFIGHAVTFAAQTQFGAHGQWLTLHTDLFLLLQNVGPFAGVTSFSRTRDQISGAVSRPFHNFVWMLIMEEQVLVDALGRVVFFVCTPNPKGAWKYVADF